MRGLAGTFSPLLSHCVGWNVVLLAIAEISDTEKGAERQTLPHEAEMRHRPAPRSEKLVEASLRTVQNASLVRHAAGPGHVVARQFHGTRHPLFDTNNACCLLLATRKFPRLARAMPARNGTARLSSSERSRDPVSARSNCSLPDHYVGTGHHRGATATLYRVVTLACASVRLRRAPPRCATRRPPQRTCNEAGTRRSDRYHELSAGLGKNAALGAWRASPPC